MKELNGWSVDDSGWLKKEVYSIEHGSTDLECQNWSRILIKRKENSHFTHNLYARDALLRNVVEVERRISTEEDFIINGYQDRKSVV